MEKTWSLFVEVVVRRITFYELLWGNGRKVTWNWGQVVMPDVNGCSLYHTKWIEIVGRYLRCMSAVHAYVTHFSCVQFSLITWYFWQTKSHRGKHEIWNIVCSKCFLINQWFWSKCVFSEKQALWQTDCT